MEVEPSGELFHLHALKNSRKVFQAACEHFHFGGGGHSLGILGLPGFDSQPGCATQSPHKQSDTDTRKARGHLQPLRQA